MAGPVGGAAECDVPAGRNGQFADLRAEVMDTLRRSQELRSSLVARRPSSPKTSQLFSRTRQELAELQRLLAGLDAMGRQAAPVTGPQGREPGVPGGTVPPPESPAATRERLRRVRLALATSYDLLAATLASTAHDQPAHAAHLRALAADARRAADTARRRAGVVADGAASDESLVEVGKQVLGVLDADREPHQVAGHLQR